MARDEFPAIGDSYPLADRNSSVSRSVNLRLSKNEGLGVSPSLELISVEGIAELFDLGAEVRGSVVTTSGPQRWFVVSGSELQEYVSGVWVVRGALGSASGRVSMVSGRDQLVIVDGPGGYVFRLNANTLETITDPDWLGSNFVDSLDGYFIFARPGTDQFYLSAIDDATNMNALDFTSADGQPDDILTFRVVLGELMLFGIGSVETWVNSGDADFPLVPYNSTPVDIGAVGAYSVQRVADFLVYVGQTARGTGIVYELRGHQPIRISTDAVEQALGASTDLSQCSMWAYQVAGGEFVGINAPGLSTTWVFDFATRTWHERGELVNGEWTPFRALLMQSYEGQQYTMAGTKIYRLAEDVYSIDGDPLARERTWTHLKAPAQEPVSYSALEVFCTTGHGGSVTLECSNDGGFTWGAPLIRSLGATGRWLERVRWMMLGAARRRSFRIRCTDAVPFNLQSVTIERGT